MLGDGHLWLLEEQLCALNTSSALNSWGRLLLGGGTSKCDQSDLKSNSDLQWRTSFPSGQSRRAAAAGIFSSLLNVILDNFLPLIAL